MTTKANFPVTAGSIVVPYGHVIGNEKWRGSEIAQRLQGKHKQIGRGKTIQAKHSPVSPSIVKIGWHMRYCLPDWSHICGTAYVSRLKIPACLSCICVISSVILT
uniref:Fanconi anemia core complex-associated protein 24 pseudonuclease domain-containing protein n=1 Tax=Buteo japonicus TaxID=224669 RepID=A0A8C0B4S6_9AVES